MENNSDVHDKREATHFRRQRANGKVGVLPLAGKNKSCLISSLAAHLPTKKNSRGSENKCRFFQRARDFITEYLFS